MVGCIHLLFVVLCHLLFNNINYCSRNNNNSGGGSSGTNKSHCQNENKDYNSAVCV